MENDDRTIRGAQAFSELIGIIHRLRSPGGCPWDREQTPATLKPFIIEEAYETIDAIDAGVPGDVAEELGDLLLQIMLQSQIGHEEGSFDIVDVVKGISQKMITRHPHVFGDVTVNGAEDVLVNWEKIKKTEKKSKGLLDGIPSHLPGLLKAARMGEKAGRVGFDWPDVASVRDKVIEELAELDEAVASGDESAVEHELGDLIFSVAQWGRHLGQMPEEAARSACDRFAARFASMNTILSKQGKLLDNCSIEEMEAVWQEAKKNGG